MCKIEREKGSSASASGTIRTQMGGEVTVAAETFKETTDEEMMTMVETTADKQIIKEMTMATEEMLIMEGMNTDGTLLRGVMTQEETTKEVIEDDPTQREEATRGDLTVNEGIVETKGGMTILRWSRQAL